MDAMWRRPAWAEGDIEEFWDKTGKVIGAVTPFGDVYQADTVIGVVGNRLTTRYYGVYLTKVLAKKAIEKFAIVDTKQLDSSVW